MRTGWLSSLSTAIWEMLAKSMQCDCCGSDGLQSLARYREYAHSRCINCGFECFVSGNAQTIGPELYENDADYADDLAVVSNWRDMFLWHHSKGLAAIRERVHPAAVRTLDIGCFNGFFVKKLLLLGYDAHGVDFNKIAIAQGQQDLGLGSRISCRSVADLIATDEHFDAITLFEVVEHVPDPRSFLQLIAQLVKPGGILIISTPNNKMCWRPPVDFPPHHVNRFTVRALQECLSQLGLRPVHAAEQMSTYELIRHYSGTFFRAKDVASLRGGAFRHRRLVNVLRRAMNRARKFMGLVFLPIDRLLYMLGVRYISLIVVAERPIR